MLYFRSKNINILKAKKERKKKDVPYKQGQMKAEVAIISQMT